MINYIPIYQGIFMYIPKETVVLILKDVDKIKIETDSLLRSLYNITRPIFSLQKYL